MSLVQTIEDEGCATTWLAAVETAFSSTHAYNVVLGVRSPTILSPIEVEITRAVDDFLRSHGSEPVTTVASTIFPAGVYMQGGVEKLFEEFSDYAPKIKGRWEGYAVRMLSKSLLVDGKPQSPLERLLNKMKKYSHTGRPLYELSIDDPQDPLLDLAIHDDQKDGVSIYPPCLMHLSIKLVEKKVLLTALYRSHYYIQKLLGNLIGLAQLQLFLAEELGSDYAAGPLICHSTYATFDRGSKGHGWTKKEAQALIAQCADIRASYRSKTTNATA